MDSKNEAIAALVAGELDADTVAARYGTSPEQVLEWKGCFLAGMRSARGGRRALLRRGRLFKLAGFGVAVLLLLASRAASSACVQKLPAGLITLCPNTPAVAEDLNRNFSRIVDLLKAKIGPIDSLDATIPGALSARGKPVLLDVYACVEDGSGAPCCLDGDSQDSRRLNEGVFLGPPSASIYLCRRYAN